MSTSWELVISMVDNVLSTKLIHLFIYPQRFSCVSYSQKICLTYQNGKRVFTYLYFVLNKHLDKVKCIDVEQNENTFTVKIVVTILTNPVPTSPGLPYSQAVPE